MNERLKEVRKALKLTQKEFAKRIGVTDGAISFLEKGERNPSEQTIIAVCREFAVDEEWLRNGNGEMFVVTENALMLQFSEQFELDAFDRIMIEGYMKLPKAHKDVIKGWVRSIANASTLPGADDTEVAEDIAHDIVNAAQEAEDAMREEWNRDLTIDEKVELYRNRLEAEEKGAVKSSISAKAAIG